MRRARPSSSNVRFLAFRAMNGRPPRRRCLPVAGLGVAVVMGATFAAAAGAATVAATDDRGVYVELPAPAQRVISLAPHLTELLFAAGAGARVVGAVAHSDYPPAARRLPRVGDASRVDMEQIVELGPDLVLGWRSGNAQDDWGRLESLGIPVFVTEPRRLESVAYQLLQLGRLTGTETRAKQAAARYLARLNALRRRYEERGEIRVFYQISMVPLYTVNRRHIINDVIELCGGRNVFAELDALAPAVSPESVIAADPEVIIAASGLSGGQLERFWRRWPAMTAVQRNNLFAVQPDQMHRATPRILKGIAEVCDALEQARRRREVSSPGSS